MKKNQLYLRVTSHASRLTTESKNPEEEKSGGRRWRLSIANAKSFSGGKEDKGIKEGRGLDDGKTAVFGILVTGWMVYGERILSGTRSNGIRKDERVYVAPTYKDLLLHC